MSAPEAQCWLLRHGETVWTGMGRFHGQADPGLSSAGRASATRMGMRLASINPDMILSSDLRRAHETAQILSLSLGSLHVSVDSRLREIDMGKWTGLTRPEIEKDDPNLASLLDSDKDFRRPGGETARESGLRVVDALREIVTGSRALKVVVVGHGFNLRWAISHLIGLGGRSVGLGDLQPLAVSCLGYRGQWRLRCYGCSEIPLGVDMRR